MCSTNSHALTILNPDLVTGSSNYILINGSIVKITNKNRDSIKFWKKNNTCCSCGIKLNFFVLFKRNDRIDNYPYRTITYHLNPFAMVDGHFIVDLTKDHIHPKSKGGADGKYNLQTMCAVCNKLKSNNESFTLDKEEWIVNLVRMNNCTNYVKVRKLIKNGLQ